MNTLTKSIDLADVLGFGITHTVSHHSRFGVDTFTVHLPIDLNGVVKDDTDCSVENIDGNPIRWVNGSEYDMVNNVIRELGIDFEGGKAEYIKFTATTIKVFQP